MKNYLVELRSDVTLSIFVEVRARSEDEARDEAESMACRAINALHTGGEVGISIDHPIEVEVIESYLEDTEEENE
jgi:hypothetical protein